MKKLILLFLLTIVTFTVKAQSLEETMDYINVNILNYGVLKNSVLKYKENYFEQTTEWTVSSEKRTKFNRVFLKDIKAISFSTDSKGFIIITILGNGNAYTVYDGEINVDNIKVSNTFMALSPNTPEENVKRLIKAMKHAAKLGGAKLVNEDLFKD